MSVVIHVPRQLRVYCGGAAQLTVAAHTVRQALDALRQRHPDLYRGVCDETDSIRRHINVFVNSSHMRELDGLETPLKSGDELMILPAVSGG